VVGQTVKITPDTNLLVRAITGDDARQSKIAQSELERADSVALALPALCELVRVLSRGYGIGSLQIVEAIRRLMDGANVVSNRAAVEAGLALLEAGGDFADGVIAYEGASLGADVFVSFDRKATELLRARGATVRLLP
jgi:predicted nucleic-acid-binding protein